MRWRSKIDHSAILYNDQITLSGIPDEAHSYTLGSRSALEWIVERYRIAVDKPSGISNDPNDWGGASDYPRYIVDLIKRITAVSVETNTIVNSLPDLSLGGGV